MGEDFEVKIKRNARTARDVHEVLFEELGDDGSFSLSHTVSLVCRYLYISHECFLSEALPTD